MVRTRTTTERDTGAKRHESPADGALPRRRRLRRSVAEVEHSDKRRGLMRMVGGLVIVLLVAILAVGGMHINEHVVHKDSSPTPTTDPNNGYTQLTRDGGYYINPQTGLKETWYSQNVLPGGGLEIEGRHVDGSGIVRDGAGYIVCASSDYEKGTIIPTSLGTAKVYDTGCPNGVVDIYTSW